MSNIAEKASWEFLDTLGSVDAPSSLDLRLALLLAALDSSNAGDRSAAASGLAQIDDPRALSALVDKAKTETNPYVASLIYAHIKDASAGRKTLMSENPKFADLEWKPHSRSPERGRMAFVKFPNGWSATLLDGERFSIYLKTGLIFEIQPWTPDDDLPENHPLSAWPYHGDATYMQKIMDLIAEQKGG